MDENGDRATVALVSAKIDGLKEMQARGFDNLQGQLDRRLGDITRQLDRLSDLPVKVAALEGVQKDAGHRIRRLEDKETGNAEWKRGPLVIAIVAGLSAFLNILVATGAIHVG